MQWIVESGYDFVPGWFVDGCFAVFGMEDTAMADVLSPSSCTR